MSRAARDYVEDVIKKYPITETAITDGMSDVGFISEGAGVDSVEG